MISCTQAVRQLWDFLEREVAPDDAARIEEHLDVCRRCCGELEFADELRRFLASHARPELPADAEERLTIFLDRIEERI
jgi:anti-sigma factor (TIGR02949 family)